MNALAGYAVAPKIDQNRLVEEHAPLLKRIAFHMINRLPPSVQVDDLIQAGVIGLLEAARNYDPSQGASFETYAGIRIRGAMVDELRRTDWTPRSVHRNTRKLADAVYRVEARLGRAARDPEIAEEMGLNLEDYYRVLRDTAVSKVLNVDDVFAAGEERDTANPDPYSSAYQDDFKGALAKTIDSLPEREKLVMSLYYDDELNLREIGEVLGVSESRVCQIHGQALVRIRARLKEWLDSGMG